MSTVRCPHCGAVMEIPQPAEVNVSVVCASCQQSFSFQFSPADSVPATTSGKAIAAFVLGLLSFVFCIFTGIPALVLGMLGLRDIKRSTGRLKGEVWAIFGMVLGVVSFFFVGIFGILAAIAIPNFLEAQVRAKVARTHSDLRSMATALESYYVDNSVYPPSIQNVERGIELPSPDGEVSLTHPGDQLTTPVAYITTIPKDVFANPNTTVMYWNSPRGGWVLAGIGPDGHPSINLPMLQELYDPTQRNPMQGLIPYVYDPTNGTKSEGDIFRIKQ